MKRERLALNSRLGRSTFYRALTSRGTICSKTTRAMLANGGLEPLLDGRACAVEDYEILRTHNRFSNRLLGLNVQNWGRTGNAVFANINALSAARHLGLKHVVLKAVDDDLVPDQTIRWKGLDAHAGLHLLGTRGSLLAGPFWDHLGGWPDVSGSEQREIAIEVVRRFTKVGAATGRPPDPNELVLHIRGGDIFGETVYGHYLQPPLAFYTRAIGDAVARHGVRCVRIVSEDNLNPCVDALKRHLGRSTIPFTHQSTSAIEDFLTVARAHHVAYAFGTFAPAACLISENIRTVFSFNDGPRPNNYAFDWLPSCHAYFDASGAYMKRGEWSNSAEQRRQMVELPVSALAECDPQSGAPVH